jgi:hypothetical protein
MRDSPNSPYKICYKAAFEHDSIAAPGLGLTHDELYAFDVRGILVLKRVLSAQQVATG